MWLSRSLSTRAERALETDATKTCKHGIAGAKVAFSPMNTASRTSHNEAGVFSPSTAEIKVISASHARHRLTMQTIVRCHHCVESETLDTSPTPTFPKKTGSLPRALVYSRKTCLKWCRAHPFYPTLDYSKYVRLFHYRGASSNCGLS